MNQIEINEHNDLIDHSLYLLEQGKIPLNAMRDRKFWEQKYISSPKMNYGGKTLAHEAASKFLIPVDFPFWDIQNEKGITVLEVAVDKKNLPAINFAKYYEFQR